MSDAWVATKVIMGSKRDPNISHPVQYIPMCSTQWHLNAVIQAVGGDCQGRNWDFGPFAHYVVLHCEAGVTRGREHFRATVLYSLPGTCEKACSRSSCVASLFTTTNKRFFICPGSSTYTLCA